jgi:hypothetical protein
MLRAQIFNQRFAKTMTFLIFLSLAIFVWFSLMLYYVLRALFFRGIISVKLYVILKRNYAIRYACSDVAREEISFISFEPNYAFFLSCFLQANKKNSMNFYLRSFYDQLHLSLNPLTTTTTETDIRNRLQKKTNHVYFFSCGG